jgi:hypothetical protein
MRPIDPYTIAHLAAEQDIARHAERLRLRVEQGIERLDARVVGQDVFDHERIFTELYCFTRPAAGGVVGEGLGAIENDGTDPRGSETLVELAPADDAVVGGQLEEMIIPPAGVTAQDFETRHLHRRAPVARGTGRG